MVDLSLLLIALGLGVLIGLNLRTPIQLEDNELPKEVKKLQDQVIVLTNLKNSLLDDVRYWRNKANNDKDNS